MFISNNLTFRSYFPTHPTFTSPQRWILWTPFSTRSWNMLIILTSFKVLLCQVRPQLVGILFVKRLYGFLWTTFQVNWLVLGWSCKPLRRRSDSDQKHKIQLCAQCSPSHFTLSLSASAMVPCVEISSLHFYNSYPWGKSAKNLRFWSRPKQRISQDVFFRAQMYPIICGGKFRLDPGSKA